MNDALNIAGFTRILLLFCYVLLPMACLAVAIAKGLFEHLRAKRAAIPPAARMDLTTATSDGFGPAGN